MTEDEDLTPISLQQHNNEQESSSSSRGPYPWRSHDATVISSVGGNSGGKNARKDGRGRSVGERMEYEELDTPPSSGIRVRTEVILSRSERLNYNNRLF